MPRSAVLSLAVHGALAIALLFVRSRRRQDAVRDRATIDMTMEARRPELPRSERPAALPQPVRVRPRTQPTPLAHAVARTIDRTTNANPATSTAVEPQTPTTATSDTPPSTNAPPQTILVAPPTTQAPLTASDLYANVDTLANSAAQAGAIDLGPTSPNRGSRDLFGRPRTGSTVDRVRNNAMASITQTLRAADHTVMPGTGANASIVSRRAEEAFSDVASLPSLGTLLMRAGITRIPPATHTPGGGERGAADSLDIAHGQSFAMAQFAAVSPERSYHLLRADIEVDQDPRGAIVATRIVRSSNVPALDQHAVRAIREAIPQGPSVQMPSGRRSGWSFEVSDGASGPAEAILGGNEGWRVMPDESNGVRIRLRVRMFRSQSLAAGTGG